MKRKCNDKKCPELKEKIEDFDVKLIGIQ